MDDQKPASDGNEPGLNKIDLTQLQDFTFGTQWTEVKQVSPGRRDREGDRGDRRDRRDDHPAGAGDARRDRRAFRKPMPAPGSPASAPSDGGAGARPPGGERRFGGERRNDGEGFRGGPRRDFRGDGPRGDWRERGEGFERGPYISPYFTVTCYPEDAGFAAMVKAVRASCRTFQLFEITKAVLEKNERFVLVVQRKTEGAPKPPEAAGDPAAAKPADAPRAPKTAPIFMSVPDHLPFETEEMAIAHVLKTHLALFFDAQEVEIEPPKGNFPIINKCSITGELLGPPNYHKYQQILQQHHATRLGRMPFERFRDSIVSVREPEVVQQWQDKMKKATRYTWKGVPLKSGIDSIPPFVGDAAAAPVAAPAASAPVENTEPKPETPAENPPAAVPAPVAAPAGPSFDSLDEARAHLLANAREKVVRAVETVRFHGKLVEKLPPGEIRRAIEGHVERQRRFPLDTANALRGRLRREGFTIFKKGSRGVSYVCAVKRRFRVPGQVFSESISTLIDFIEKNPMVPVKELPLKFLAIDVAAALAAQPAPPEGTAPSQAPFAALPPEQAERLRKMNNDLRWLVTEGYVTEFSDSKLFAPPAVVPQAAKRAEEHGEEHDPVDFPDAAPAETPPPAAAEAQPVVTAEAPATPAEAPADPIPAPEPTSGPAEPAAEVVPPAVTEATPAPAEPQV